MGFNSVFKGLNSHGETNMSTNTSPKEY